LIFFLKFIIIISPGGFRAEIPWEVKIICGFLDGNMNLNKNQQTEYNTLIIASLLQDVGELLEKHGKPFDYEHFRHLIIKKNIDIDPELLEMLHHINRKPGEFHGDREKGEREERKIKAFADIIKNAYLISKGRGFDDKDEGIHNGENENLLAIFSLLKTAKSNRDPLPKYYSPSLLSPHSIFPVFKDMIKSGKFDVNILIQEFSTAIKAMDVSNFNELFNVCWNLLRKYLWAIPISAIDAGETADLSLFDHLSTASAFAASLYWFHKDNPDEKSITRDEETFILVGGDLSGIQSFIFEIEQRNPKKLSQTLRGRSFLLSLLVEIVSLKILNEFHLPFSAKIMSSGGRFLILVPNTKDAADRLMELQSEIETEFFKYFAGKVTLSLDFSTVLNMKDFGKPGLKNKIADVNISLNRLKLKKNQLLLKSKTYNRYLGEIYEKLVMNKACGFCGVFPALDSDPGAGSDDKKCRICELSEKIGSAIIKNTFILFKSKEKSDILDFLGIAVIFSNKIEKSLLAYSIIEAAFYDSGSLPGDDEINQKFLRGSRGQFFQKAPPGRRRQSNFIGSIDYSISNFLPDNSADLIGADNDDEQKLCFHCRRNDLINQCDSNTRSNLKNSHLSFQCIAAYTPFSRRGRGSDKLAVLKADIDNLGYIFQEGIPGEKYNISHFTFLSRMLELFFQDWLKNILREKFPMIYTVYSGGDDLLLIGPWFNVIEFSLYFREKFQEFTANNPDITFSAGISLFSPHSPVTTAVRQAEEYLELSKSKGRNSLTLFDTTIKWDKLSGLLDFADFLDSRIRDDNSRINVGFVQRMFKYHRLFLEFEKGEVEGLRFLSLMNYDIARNIQVIKDGRLINREEIQRLKPLYEPGETLNKELWRNLKIPLFIALYKQRR
jgi:CRISPR-associated protein Csm1